jgi:hypothetical protein
MSTRFYPLCGILIAKIIHHKICTINQYIVAVAITLIQMTAAETTNKSFGGIPCGYIQ